MFISRDEIERIWESMARKQDEINKLQTDVEGLKTEIKVKTTIIKGNPLYEAIFGNYDDSISIIDMVETLIDELGYEIEFHPTNQQIRLKYLKKKKVKK